MKGPGPVGGWVFVAGREKRGRKVRLVGDRCRDFGDGEGVLEGDGVLAGGDGLAGEEEEVREGDGVWEEELEEACNENRDIYR